MPGGLQFALSNPLPGREAEFSAWYGGHHIFAAISTPGLLAGQRFRRVDGPWPEGEHEFLAIWELDDPAYALSELAKVKGTAKMPVSDAIDSAGIQPPTMWVRASVRNGARIVSDSTSRGPCVVMMCRAREGEEAAFEHSLLHGGLAAVVDRPGVLCADFLTLADEQIRNNTRKIQFALLIELVDEVEGFASLVAALPALPHLDPDKWKAPVFRPVGRRIEKAEALAHREHDADMSAGIEARDLTHLIST